jgi:hypothetical protein
MIPAEHRKSVTFNQNGRSRSVGKTGHVQTESAVNFVRNTHWRGFCGCKRHDSLPLSACSALLGGTRLQPCCRLISETPRTAAHCHRCDPMGLSSRQRYAWQSEPQDHHQHYLKSHHALFPHEVHTASCHTCRKSRVPNLERTRIASRGPRRSPTRTTRVQPRHMRTPRR